MTRANIRFYEKEGLIAPERNSNGYRNYSEEDLSILKRIRLLRTLHLSLEDIKSLSRNEQELSGLLIRHLTALKKEQQALGHSVKVCEQLCKDRAVYSSFDAQHYLDLLDTSVSELPSELKGRYDAESNFAVDQILRAEYRCSHIYDPVEYVSVPRPSHQYYGNGIRRSCCGSYCI